MKKVRIVFFGTPQFAAEILRFLIERQVEIAAIVTQPDRPKGRALQLTPSPVKQVAQKYFPDCPIFQPEKASEALFLERLRAVDANLYVVVAFGQILPQKLLDIPPLGCINVHASLLPKYRGAAPIHRCLMNGDKETGIAIQKMVKQLDAGDVIAEARIPVPQEMTFGELEKALCELSKPLLLSVLKMYAEAVPAAAPQDVSLVTFAPKVEPEEGEIDWAKPAGELHNLIRAFSPRPGAWVWVYIGEEKKRLKVFRTEVVTGEGPAGQIISSKNLIVACGENALQLIEIQPEGKARMQAADWLRGLKSPVKFK